jgi:hypothetical protein
MIRNAGGIATKTAGKLTIQEEAFAGDRERRVAAVVDLARAEHGGQHRLHPVEVADDEGQVAQALDHSIPSVSSAV